jgi:bacterioferritin
MLFFEDVDHNSIQGQIEILNRLHADEIRAAMQYVNHQVAYKGINCLPIQEMFYEHYQDELGHAEKLRNLIDWLGGLMENGLEMMSVIGPGALKGKGDVQMSQINEVMLEQDLTGEDTAIEAYSEAIAIFQPRVPMVALALTEIITDEYEHRRDLRNLLNL